VVDDEVRKLVDGAHEHVTRLLTDHREQLESLAQALLKAETLDSLDAYTAAGVPARVAEQPSEEPAVALHPRTST
jgi:cell division protease FtsH